MAYWTHCRTEYELAVGKGCFKHNQTTKCLSCSSECIVKSNGLRRSSMTDSAYVVWYDKSIVDPNAIVSRALYVQRYYSGDYRQTETAFNTRAIYMFDPGRGGRQFRPNDHGEWAEMRSVFSYVVPQTRSTSPYCSAIEAFCSLESIEQAVAGSVLQYSMWSEYEDESEDFISFFDLAAKYPCVEYLTKMGLCELVLAKLRGVTNYGAVNWRGKSVDKVLRMPRADIRQLTKLTDVQPKSLHSYHFWRKLGWAISPTDAHILRDLTDDFYWKMIIANGELGTAPEIAQYVLKQMKRTDAPAIYNRASYVLTEWRDYIRDGEELGMDTRQAHVAFPADLHSAHEKTMRKVKLKQSEATNRLIEARVAILEVFTYVDGQFLIRPAKSVLELFDEGKALNHCVGGYADGYASGSRDLFVVRRTSDPNTPFCTVEVVKGKIVQARGYKNSIPDSKVSAFLKRFARKLAKPRNKQSTNTAQNHPIVG